MRRLRIAFVAGGGFTHIRPYIDFFKERGHEVFLIAYAALNSDYGVPTFDVSRGARGNKASSKWRYLLAGWSARQIIRHIKPDLLHGHYVTSAGTICLLSGFRPYVLTVHGSDLMTTYSSRLWRPILKTVFARAALVNTVSDQLRDLALGMDVPADKLLVATLGVDTRKFAYRPPPPMRAPVRLLCTRTLGELYDPFTIVRACALLRDRGRDFTMTFAAGGPLEPQVKQLVYEKKLEDRLRFFGGYVNGELPRLLREYDAYISASRWDGTSICLLEAMACGLPPVVSRIPSNLAWLDDGHTALMFDCGNAVQLAECLDRLMTDDLWGREAAERNRGTVMERANRVDNMSQIEGRFLALVDTPLPATVSGCGEVHSSRNQKGLRP